MAVLGYTVASVSQAKRELQLALASILDNTSMTEAA